MAIIKLEKFTPTNVIMNTKEWINTQIEYHIHSKYSDHNIHKIYEKKDQLNPLMFDKLVDVLTVVSKDDEVHLHNVDRLDEHLFRKGTNLVNFNINGENVEAIIHLSSFGKYVSVEHSSKMTLIFILSGDM